MKSSLSLKKTAPAQQKKNHFIMQLAQRKTVKVETYYNNNKKSK